MIRICLKFMHFDPSAGEVSYWPFPDLVSVAWWAHRVLTGGTVDEIRDLAKHVHDRIAEYFAWARHDALSSAVAHLAENCTACGARRGYRHEGLEFGQAHDLWPNGDSPGNTAVTTTGTRGPSCVDASSGATTAATETTKIRCWPSIGAGLGESWQRAPARHLPHPRSTTHHTVAATVFGISTSARFGCC
jgi:hypothetical protein